MRLAHIWVISNRTYLRANSRISIRTLRANRITLILKAFKEWIILKSSPNKLICQPDILKKFNQKYQKISTRFIKMSTTYFNKSTRKK